MNLLTIKKRSSRSRLKQKQRWLWLPSEFGISGIFMSTRDIHPLTELFRAIYFNRYENATLPYKESLQHFSSTIWRRWGYWPNELLKPIFERLETTVESELKENGGWVGFNSTPRGKNHFKDLCVLQRKITTADVLRKSFTTRFLRGMVHKISVYKYQTTQKRGHRSEPASRMVTKRVGPWPCR